MKYICVLIIVTSLLYPQDDHFLLGIWPGNNYVNEAETMTYLFNSNRLHLLKELEIDAIIHSKDWIFGAAMDSGFKILYKPFWWTEGYNYGQKWTYQYDINNLHFDPSGLIGLIEIDEEALNELVNMADPEEHDEGYLMDDLKVYWQQDRNTCLWTGTNPNEYVYDYKAKFYLKVGDNDGRLPIATLYVERGDTPHPDETTNWTVLDSRILWPNDFQTTTNYEIFTLNFDHSDLSPIPSIIRDLDENQNLELRNSNAPEHCMNYRIYWHDNVALSSWKVVVIDHFAESVIDGDIDDRIDSLLAAPSAIHVPYYYRDEPESDQLFVEEYITNKIETAGKKQYTNLYPIYADYFQYDMDFLQSNDNGYPEYLENVSAILNPKYSGADHYPDLYQGNHKFRIRRFINELEQTPEIPSQRLFYQVATGPNQSWININSYLPIAFGAKGLIYFHWYFLTIHSTHTERYNNTQNVTRHIRGIEDHLLGLNLINTYSSTPLTFPPASIITSVSEDSLVIGEFNHPDSSGTYLFVVNLRIEDPDSIDSQINIESKIIGQRVHYLSNTYFGTNPDQIILEALQTTIPISLQPGEGKLLRIVDDPPPAKPTGMSLINQGGHPLVSWAPNQENDIVQYKVNIAYENRVGPPKFWTYTYETHYTTDAEYYDGGFFIGASNTYAYYRVQAIDEAYNMSALSNPVSTSGNHGKTLVNQIPFNFSLYSNFPNPFNPVTQIMYGLPEKSEVQLVVYDLLGREIVTLKNGITDPGWFIVQWEGINNSGKRVPSGVYIYTLSAQSLESNQNFAETKKMVLLK